MAVYNSKEEALKHGVHGILAGISYPSYSILVGEHFLSFRASSAEQAALLNQLAVGDNVIFEMQERNPVIKGIIARRSQLVRLRADASRLGMANAEEHVIAANVDLAVIVASVAQPPFHPRLVDRYLIMCQYGNVKPLLCLTKIDLAPIPDVSMYRHVELPVVGVSNKTEEGIGNLMPYLEGKCCVLVGNSGVGKSSLINTLLKKEIISTKEVGEKSGKGRHTTSTSSLHLINKSTFLIDTPGIRSLGLWTYILNLCACISQSFQSLPLIAGSTIAAIPTNQNARLKRL